MPGNDPYHDLIKSALDEADRIAVAQLAHCVRELITIVGTLNALTGMATDQETARHAAIRDELLELLASTTSIARRFNPEIEPE